MAHQVDGIIVAVRNLLVKEGHVDGELLSQIVRLVNFCRERSIEPVFLSNHGWTVSGTSGKRSIKEALAEQVGDTRWFIAKDGDCPFKPKASATAAVIKAMGWDPLRVLYLGNTKDDMITAVSGGLLFLKATWYEEGTPYGVTFGSPEEVARFIDVFCSREHLWHFEIRHGDLEYYSLAPFSTMTRRFPHYVGYSQDARDAAKFGGGHPEFWTQYLWSTLYFSGLHRRFDYAACYPGHSVDSPLSLMAEPVATFARCFRKRLLPDLIVRHTTAQRSHVARAAGGTVDQINQLNTIRLTPNPIKTMEGKRYKNPPLKPGKTVLVVDDFCTAGNSLEAARMYIQQAGARMIGVSWLKTINTDYLEILGPTDPRSWNPYEGARFSTVGNIDPHGYYDTVSEDDAAKEVDEKLARFVSWEWK